MYYGWPKMKRDTQQKSSLFLSKRAVFLSGISFYFRPFVVCYSFSGLLSWIWLYEVQLPGCLALLFGGCLRIVCSLSAIEIY